MNIWRILKAPPVNSSSTFPMLQPTVLQRRQFITICNARILLHNYPTHILYQYIAIPVYSHTSIQPYQYTAMPVYILMPMFSHASILLYPCQCMANKQLTSTAVQLTDSQALPLVRYRTLTQGRPQSEAPTQQGQHINYMGIYTCILPVLCVVLEPLPPTGPCEYVHNSTPPPWELSVALPEGHT